MKMAEISLFYREKSQKQPVFSLKQHTGNRIQEAESQKRTPEHRFATLFAAQEASLVSFYQPLGGNIQNPEKKSGH